MARPKSDLTLARLPIDHIPFERRSRIFVDIACPHLGRRTSIIRELPVRLLTAWECNRLHVHCHPKPVPGRRKAYWAKVVAFYNEQAARGERVGFPANYRL